MPQYKTEEIQQVTNTAIAATTSEQVLAGTLRVNAYNALTIINADNVEIEVLLDNDTTQPIKVLPKTAGILAAEEGRFFHTIVQVNKDAAAAETAGKITFTASYQVALGE